MARIWHRNKCLIISTSYLASVTILTLSHRALSGSQWEGMEDWMAGNTECNCQPFVAAKWNVSNMLKSFCGPTADLRGPGQRVLSFSLYGKMVQEGSGDWQMLEYIKGVRGNVEDMRVHYPKGYTLRVYHDKNWEENPEQMRHLCKVYCDHRDVVDLCPVRKLTLRIPAAAAYSERPLLPKFGMLWRFSPIADPLVAEFHSRDLDSRPTEREWAAVEEWLRSNRTFHVMRDHYSHKVAMLGGLWGMRLTQNAKRLGAIHLFDRMLSRGAKWYKGLDQVLLEAYMWPMAKGDMVAHDSWHCEWFSSPMNRPWPVRRESGGRNFVGSSFEKQSITKECPRECRPRKHPEWTLC